jgi:hypothetical protein
LALTNECDWGFGNDLLCNEDGWITSMDLKEQGLTGALPAEIGHLTHLGEMLLEGNELVLRGNQIGGTIPTAIGMLTRLTQYLILTSTVFVILPTELFQLLTSKKCAFTTTTCKELC